MIRIFRAAGYRTAVLSSHVRASEFWDGPCTLMKKDAAETQQLDRDGQLLEALGQWLARDPAPRRLAVLHLFGSHYDYAERYPESFERFQGGNTMVDTYDNSIAFTDHVLGRLIAGLTDQQVYLPAYDLSRAPYTPQPQFLINSLRDSVAEEVIRATPHGRKPATGR